MRRRKQGMKKIRLMKDVSSGGTSLLMCRTDYIQVHSMIRSSPIIYFTPMKASLIIVVLCLVVFSLAETLHKVLLDDPTAKCLDGSPGAYYFHQADPSKVVIYFEGGGWCGSDSLQSTLESCYQRSKGALGSSKLYPDTFSSMAGFLSDSKDNIFQTWSKVYLKYCDGSGHQGTRSQPVTYKDTSLYFRGNNITIAQLNSIDKALGLFSGKVSNVVLSGCSAGGLAAYHWANYLSDHLPDSTKFWVVPDSGLFLDEMNVATGKNSYRVSLQNVMKYSNEEVTLPNDDCHFFYVSQPWKCFFAQYVHPYIKAPLLPTQSLYDTWSIPNILGIHCIQGQSLSACTTKDKQTIEEYHQKTKKVLSEMSEKKGNGAWAPVCLNHCYTTGAYSSSVNYRVPSGSEYSIMRSVQKWMEGSEGSAEHVDEGDWPSNRPCAGIGISSIIANTH